MNISEGNLTQSEIEDLLKGAYAAPPSSYHEEEQRQGYGIENVKKDLPQKE